MDKIGFAKDLLLPQAVRLDVLLFDDSGALFLDKPTGFLLDVCKEERAFGPVLVEALRKELKREKPELAQYNIETPATVYPMDGDSTGVALLAVNKDSREALRNQFGAREMEFTFQFIAKEAPGLALDEEFDCDLPVFWDEDRGCMRVSNAKGKRTKTVFRRLEQFRGYSVWEARSDYIRAHQIRVHASELGLSILGEMFYERQEHLYLSSLKRGYLQTKHKQERPLYEGMALHLSSVKYENGGGESVRVESPLPKRWTVMLKHMREHIG